MAKAIASCHFEGEKENFEFKALYCQPSTAFQKLAIVTSTPELDFLKVLRFWFPVPVVGPTAKDFFPLQLAKFTGGIFLM